MNKQIIFFLSCLSVILMMVMGGCGRNTRKEIDRSRYSEGSAMSHFVSDPDRALTLLDSAVIVGNLHEARAEYLKSMVVLNGLDNADSCIKMCQDLLDREVWTSLPESEDATLLHVRILSLQATAATNSWDVNTLLNAAEKGLSLTHGQESLKSEEAEFLGRSGYVMFRSGREEEGIANMQKAVQTIDKTGTWDGEVVYLSIVKKLISSLIKAGRFQEALTTTQEAVARLKFIMETPEDLERIPPYMIEDKESLGEFLSYYLPAISSYMANAYAKIGQFDSSKVWLRRYEREEKEYNALPSIFIVEPMIEIGMYREAQKHIEKLEDLYGKDSLRRNFITLIEHKALLASKTGREKEVFDLLSTASRLNNKYNSIKYGEQLAKATASFYLQEERLARKDAERVVEILSVTLILLAIILILAYLLERKRRKANSFEHELKNAKKEIISLQEKTSKESTSAAISSKEIYKRALFVMETQKPFINKDFDIQKMAQMVFTSRTPLSNAINSESGMNFRTWLAHYRVNEAKRILSENPSLEISTMLEKCGFDNTSTLYRHFKTLTGMTPKEYASRLLLERPDVLESPGS